MWHCGCGAENLDHKEVCRSCGTNRRTGEAPEAKAPQSVHESVWPGWAWGAIAFVFIKLMVNKIPAASSVPTLTEVKPAFIQGCTERSSQEACERLWDEGGKDLAEEYLAVYREKGAAEAEKLLTRLEEVALNPDIYRDEFIRSCMARPETRPVCKAEWVEWGRDSMAEYLEKASERL